MSKIQWTNKTWNPTTGCNKVSQGCKNCYAEVMHKRQMAMNPHKYTKPFSAGVEVHEDELIKPYKWKKPCMIFVNSMSDLFHEDVPFEFIVKVYAIMKACPQHTFQVLTKRIERALEFYKWVQGNIDQLKIALPILGFVMKNEGAFFPPSNVWIGTSCEDQTTYNQRVPILLQIPAAIRFLSCEPLLGPIDLRFDSNCMDYNHADFGHGRACIDTHKIHWVIAGGESGHKARPVHPDWIRSLRNQCDSKKGANIPFFFKQWGEYLPFEETGQPPFYRDCATGEEHDGHLMNMINYDHYSEAGKFKGFRWYPPMDAIDRCLENDSNDCSWLKMGKSKSGNMLDGKQYLEFPTTKK
jgi:protein gp37